MKKSNVKVEITVYLECTKEENQNFEELLKSYFRCNEEHSLDIIGSYRSINNDVEIYLAMNTTGSYEDNLDKFRQLHLKLDEFLKNNSIKYKGMSLVPNKVKWN